MQTILNTPDDPAHDSLVEKKSEFIGDAAHVDTLDEALDQVFGGNSGASAWLRSVSSIRKPDTWRMPPCAEARMGDCPNA